MFGRAGVGDTGLDSRVETVFQANGATNLEINCLFGGWGSSTGQAWYDDVVLEAIAEPHDEPRAAVTIDTKRLPCSTAR